jgi:hypothetical protein
MSAQSSQFKFIINTSTFTATSVAIPSAATAADGSTLFNSNPEKGDGYFGSADGLHTVTYTITPNFIGTLTMQASLATAPVEADWFNVVDNNNRLPIVYNNVTAPATTTTNYVNFTGNFVWVRAVVQRSSDQPNGSVTWINYNH